MPKERHNRQGASCGGEKKGLILGETAIVHRRRQQNEPVYRCSFLYHRALISTLGDVEKCHEDVNQ
jgi:hypothetical protein